MAHIRHIRKHIFMDIIPLRLVWFAQNFYAKILPQRLLNVKNVKFVNYICRTGHPDMLLRARHRLNQLGWYTCLTTVSVQTRKTQ